MCRGCFLLTKGGKATTDEYLQCMDEYKKLIGEFERLNKAVSRYKESLDGKSRGIVDRFHKELIKVKRSLCDAESKLDFKLEWDDDSMRWVIPKG